VLPVTDHRLPDPHLTCVPPEALLRLASDTFDQYEALKLTLTSQYRALTSDYTEGDKGGSFGKGIPEDHPAAVSLAVHITAVEELEHQAELELKRAWRKHPVAAWAKDQVGLGERQMARLLAAVGDPCWNTRDDRPRRGPYELFAYCGYAPDQKRRKGVQSNWNAAAKMRAFLVAESCVKQKASPYRKVYDTRRAHTAETHPDWTPGHSHNDALRVAAKAVLKDLFFAHRQAKRLTTPRVCSPAGAVPSAESHSHGDPHVPAASADPLPHQQTSLVAHPMALAPAGGGTPGTVQP
jgi:hypothetical protein